jgi:HEAT repeat protein
MGKKRRILIAALLVILLGGFAWWLLHPREPSYHGKSLSAWLVQYTESDGGASEVQAEEAIRVIGTNGLPILLKWIGSKDSVLRAKAIALSRKQTLVRIPCYTDEERRIIARVGFGVLGSTAAPAVPALIDLLNNDGDSDVQGEVVMALGRIGPAAQDAVPAIIKCLNGTNRFAALFAPNVLATIHKKPELVIPALIQHLEESKHKPLDVRRTIEAIGNFGTNAKSAVPDLTAMLNDQDLRTREAATNALKQIDPEAAAKAGVK